VNHDESSAAWLAEGFPPKKGHEVNDTKALIILQNAWLRPSSLAYCQKMEPKQPGYTRRLWEYALWQSRTGRRLEVLTGDRNRVWSDDEPCWYYVDESTPVIGTTPSSRPPADPSHVRRLLDEHRPQVVVACGTQARDVVRPLWPGHLLAVPHPTHRVLTDALYHHAGRLLRGLLKVGAEADADAQAALDGARRINGGADPVRLLFVQERGRVLISRLAF
jgi:hypothetical protein